jgi:hypothetical protein
MSSPLSETNITVNLRGNVGGKEEENSRNKKREGLRIQDWMAERW